MTIGTIAPLLADANGALDVKALMSLLIPLGLFVGVVLLIFIAAGWVIFTKAGKPGWASIVPIYRQWVLIEICQKPPLWFVLLIIPCTAPFIAIMLPFALAKVFGKGTGFGLGLLFFAPIFILLLAFGDAKYQPAAGPNYG